MGTVTVDNTSNFRALARLSAPSTEGSSTRNEQKPEASRASPGPMLQRLEQRKDRTSPKAPSQNFLLYSWHARQILADVTEMRNLVLDKRKEYILCSNAFSLYGAQRFMSDADRKHFDRETDLAIKNCTKLIRDLELRITSDRSLCNGDECRHLSVVVNLLNVYLKEVLAIVAQLRKIHLKKTRHIRRICRLANLVEMYGPRLENVQKEEEELDAKLVKMRLELEKNENRQRRKIERIVDKGKDTADKLPEKASVVLPEATSEEMDGWGDAMEIFEVQEEPFALTGVSDEIIDLNESVGDGWSDAALDSVELLPALPRPKEEERRQMPFKTISPGIEEEKNEQRVTPYEPTEKGEQAQLVAENKKIFERFTASDSELQLIESHVEEIQRLQNMFSEKICEQEQEIDVIHSRTVYTLDNLEQANDYIREAIKNQANRRVIMIFCLLVLTFTLLFLDWYNP